MILTIDGVNYDVKCSVRRQADVRDTEISGELLDGSYFHDVAGTYFDYEISFLYPLYDKDKYAAIYEVLTKPVDGHSFVLPYNNSTITLTAKVDTLADELLEFETGTKYWRSLVFRLISNAPSKTMSLSQVLLRGRAPLPDVATPAQGTTYTWDGTTWVASVTYEDADDISF